MLRGGSWQLGDKGTHYIKTIKNSSHHLANIINDILDAAAFSKGRLVIKREKVGPPDSCTLLCISTFDGCFDHLYLHTPVVPLF